MMVKYLVPGTVPGSGRGTSMCISTVIQYSTTENTLTVA